MGSTTATAVRPNDIGIEIEAGQAFGTGHHGTTAGCLLAIEREAKARPIRNALDVGTGSGVLAIALARLAKARVLASDIDPVATRVAAENVRLNGVAGFVRCITAVGLAGRAFAGSAPYDLVVANILAGPLAALAPAIRRAVAPGGTVILSGLLPAQRARILATYRMSGLVCVSAHGHRWLADAGAQAEEGLTAQISVRDLSRFVIPAKAGIQILPPHGGTRCMDPAFAGMTTVRRRA